MLFKKTLLASALLALGGFAVSAGAATTQTGPSFDVKLKVANTCDVGAMTAEDLDFGTHDINDTTVTRTTTLKLKCTNGNIFKIGFNEGAHPGTASDTNTRRMTDGSNHFIAYDLLQSAGGAHWGNNPADSQQFTGTGNEETYTVYGQATLTGSEPAGDYSDTVVASVTF